MNRGILLKGDLHASTVRDSYATVIDNCTFDSRTPLSNLGTKPIIDPLFEGYEYLLCNGKALIVGCLATEIE